MGILTKLAVNKVDSIIAFVTVISIFVLILTYTQFAVTLEQQETYRNILAILLIVVPMFYSGRVYYENKTHHYTASGEIKFVLTFWLIKLVIHLVIGIAFGWLLIAANIIGGAYSLILTLIVNLQLNKLINEKEYSYKIFSKLIDLSDPIDNLYEKKWLSAKSAVAYAQLYNLFKTLSEETVEKPEYERYDEKEIPEEQHSGFSPFSNCDTLEKLDKRYKNLAKAFHPDTNSGDLESMQYINNEYERLKKMYV